MLPFYREIQTVMHPLKKRQAIVTQVTHLDLHRVAITFTGPEFFDFVSLSPDDHVKVFISTADGEVMRDYTPRKYDKTTNSLTLEFFLHQNGPASKWAANAKPGDVIHIGGPKGSRIVPYHFDAYLMIGDETALPSITRRLEEMPSSSRTILFLRLKANTEIQFSHSLEKAVDVTISRSNEESETEFIQKIESHSFFRMHATDQAPAYFTWIACEKHLAFRIKQTLIENKQTPQEWIKASGYWTSESDKPS